MEEPKSRPHSRVRRTLRRALITALALYLGAHIVVLFVETPMLYPGAGDKRPDMLFPPRLDDGTEGEVVTLRTADGLDLTAFYLRPDPAAPTLLWAHGNGGTIQDRTGSAAEVCRQTGMNVFQLEYRGYLGNPGKPSDDGFAEDALAAYRWLTEEADPPVTPERLLIGGRSLGGAVAIRLCEDVGNACAGLWVESTFTSVPAMVRHLYPPMPMASWLIRNKHDSLSRAPGVDLPVLSIHGTADSLVPVEQGDALCEAFPGPVTRLRVEGGEHNDTPWRDPARYWRTVRQWVQDRFPAHDLPSPE